MSLSTILIFPYLVFKACSSRKILIDKASINAQNTKKETCKHQYPAPQFGMPIGDGLVYDGSAKFINIKYVMRTILISHFFH